MALAGGAHVGVMAAGECAGAVGCWARTSPDTWDVPIAQVDGQGIRDRLHYAGDPLFARDTAIAVAFASADARDGLPDEVAASVGDVRLHAHVAIASFRPIPRDTHHVSTVGAVVAEQPLRTVMHAVRAPGAETAFVRGAVWIARIEPSRGEAAQ